MQLLAGLEHLVVQDIFLTATAQKAHVVFPAAASWCEAEGTVTDSERRVQRVRKALNPPGQARDDITILCDLARLLGYTWAYPRAEAVWDEVHRLSPNHAGMSYARLDALGGLQWPCTDETHAGTPFLHGRLWERPVRGPKAPFHAVHDFRPHPGRARLLLALDPGLGSTTERQVWICDYAIRPRVPPSEKPWMRCSAP